MRLRQWLSLAVGGGAIAAALVLPAHSDWTQVYAAAHALLAGQDPYTTVTHDGYPLYYPLPAAVLALPFAGFSPPLAQALWAGFSAATCAYALLGRGWWGLLAFASPFCLNALFLGQWSPLAVGATALPWLGAVWAAKPTIGLAFLAAYPSRKALVSIALVGLVSLIMFPSWPLRWIGAMDAAPHIRVPLTRPGGILLLLALLRWRRPEARLLAGLACVPQTIMPYELLPVFLVPQTMRQMGLMVLLSQAAFAVALTRAADTTYGSMSATLTAHWPVYLALVYLPAVLMVLRSQPAPLQGETGPLVAGARPDASDPYVGGVGHRDLAKRFGKVLGAAFSILLAVLAVWAFAVWPQMWP